MNFGHRASYREGWDCAIETRDANLDRESGVFGLGIGFYFLIFVVGGGAQRATLARTGCGGPTERVPWLSFWGGMRAREVVWLFWRLLACDWGKNDANRQVNKVAGCQAD